MRSRSHAPASEMRLVASPQPRRRRPFLRPSSAALRLSKNRTPCRGASAQSLVKLYRLIRPAGNLQPHYNIAPNGLKPSSLFHHPFNVTVLISSLRIRVIKTNASTNKEFLRLEVENFLSRDLLSCKNYFYFPRLQRRLLSAVHPRTPRYSG